MEDIKKKTFCMHLDELITEFETNIEYGLSSSEVLRRQNLYGLNEIKQEKGHTSYNYVSGAI